MKKSFKLALYISLSIGILIVITSVIANYLLESKIKKLITEDLPENMKVSYKEIAVHSLRGSASLTNPKLTIKNKEDGINYAFLEIKNLNISGISYWDYVIYGEIHIDKILINNPKGSYYKDLKIKSKDIQKKETKIDKPIFVDLFQFENAEIAIYEADKDSTKLYTQDLSVAIQDIELNTETVNKQIPFKYNSISATSDSVFIKANDYDNLTIENFSIENNNLIINNLNFKTKYPKTELSQIIAIERDHYDLSIKSVTISDYNFGFTEEEFYTKIQNIHLDTPSLSVFRDKLVTDDLSIKPLYSKSLRELPFELTVDSVHINNGFIEYEEKVKKENNGGAINFKKLNAAISNVSNTYKSPEKTLIDIDAIFMDKAPISVQWSFDVQNPNDEFIFKAKVGALEAEKMNRFTEPNLKVRLEGRVNQTYFTIDGNDNTSQTDMKINYSDFKVSVVQNDGEKKNKFLSAIVNVFISKDSEKQNNQYKEASAEATRDKTKSIFNFLWISLKSALQKCVT